MRVSESASEMDIAVALFERGFTQERIALVLEKCTNLEAALASLTGGSGNAAAIHEDVVEVQAKPCSSPLPSCPERPRRRAVGKVPDPRFQPAKKNRVGDVADSSLLAESMATGSPEHKQSVVAIEARDATTWWRSAKTALWQKSSSSSASTRRPPATPCSSSSRLTHASLASSATPTAESPTRLSLCETPCASPNALRLNKGSETCEICCNDVTSPCQSVRLGCSHGWYCAQCICRHADMQLSTGCASITCPECDTTIAEKDLRKMLPTELIDRLHARSLEQAVSATADLWPCPTPNCLMRVALEEGELPRLKCTVCKKTSCLKCGAQPYHTGTTCQGFAQRKRARDEGMDDLMKWIEETGAKQCPTCRIVVTKQKMENQHTQYSECHKMCCRNCGTRFCFKCLAVLTDTFTCGCSIDAHGFINPLTGKRLNHLRFKGKVKGKASE